VGIDALLESAVVAPAAGLEGEAVAPAPGVLDGGALTGGLTGGGLTGGLAGGLTGLLTGGLTGGDANALLSSVPVIANPPTVVPNAAAVSHPTATDRRPRMLSPPTLLAFFRFYHL